MIPAITAVLAMAVVIATPAVFAESGDGSKKYMKYWTVSIGDASGTLEITPDTDLDSLREQAISSEEASAGHENVVKTRLSKAVNDSEEYFLVWKVVTESTDENDPTHTVDVLDAGTGNLLTSMTKEGGGCGFKKSGTTETGGRV